jgi:hypothetical protein
MTAIFLDHGFPGHQVVQSPTINSLAEIAKDLNIDLDDNELKEYQGVFFKIAECQRDRFNDRQILIVNHNILKVFFSCVTCK